MVTLFTIYYNRQDSDPRGENYYTFATFSVITIKIFLKCNVQLQYIFIKNTYEYNNQKKLQFRAYDNFREKKIK